MDRKGDWSLAPAYDICFSYSPSSRWTNRHQLSLNNKREDFTRNDLLAAAQKADVRNPVEILQEVADAISQWRRLAGETEVKPEHTDFIDQNLLLNISR